MKKVLFVLVALFFLSASLVFGQIANVIFDFEESAGGYAVGWGANVTSVAQTNHAEFGGVLEVVCAVDTFSATAVRVDGLNIGWTVADGGPEFMTADIYIPADFPDSSFIQFYMMDRTHWSWKRSLYSPTYLSGGREMVIGGWNTFVFEIKRENQVDPANFTPTAIQTGFEFQIFEPWTGSVLIDNITLWEGGKTLYDFTETTTGFSSSNKFITLSQVNDAEMGGVLQAAIAVDSATVVTGGADGVNFPEIKYSWTDSTDGEYLFAADVFFPADFPDSGFVQFYQMDKNHWGWVRTIYAPVERTGFGGDNSTLIKKDAWNTLVFEIKLQHQVKPTIYFPWAKIAAGIEINPKDDFTGNILIDNIRVYPKQETVIVVDAEKDDFYSELTGPDDGYLQMRWFTFTQGALGKIADNDADHSVKLWSAWDEEWFYIYEEVTDDTLSMAGNQLWKNDQIEIKIDPVPDDSTKTSNFETRLSALGVADVPTTEKADDLNNIADSLKQFARKVTDYGYVLELAIKWEALKLGAEVITPAVGNVFGATLQNHDNDGGVERESTVAWGAVLNDDAWKTPKYLGTVKFLADNKVQFIPSNNMTGVTNTMPYDGSFPALAIDAQKDPLYITQKTPDEGHIHIPARAFNDSGAPKNNKDLSALVWVAWDSTYLYFYEEVADDTVSGSNATHYFNDKFELKIDPDPSQAATAGIVDLGITALDSADVDSTKYAGVLNRAAGDYARRKTDNGYALEMRVKWTDIVTTGTAARGPIVPAVGNTFGMSILQHDNDAATRSASIQWSAVMGDKVWNNPQMLGTVEFMPDSKLKLIPVNAITGVANDSAEVWYDPTGITKVSVKENTKMVASEFKLMQNYPNPFNPSTTISFSIVKNANVRLTVFDILGREVATLVNETKAAGSYDVTFDAKELASGVYFYKLESNNNVKTHKMLLIK